MTATIAGETVIASGDICAPVLADVDGDCRRELVVNSSNRPVLFILRTEPDCDLPAGSIKQAIQYSKQPGETSEAAPTVVDLDGDGIPEILLGTGGRILRHMRCSAAAAVLVLIAASAASAEPPPTIPLVPGLLVVGVIDDARGDYETIVKVERVDDGAVRLLVSDNIPVPRPCPTCPRSQRLVAHRNVLKVDLERAHRAVVAFRNGADETFPGTTAVQISREMVLELREHGETAFEKTMVVLGGKMAKLSDDLGKLRHLRQAPDPDDNRLKLVEKVRLPVLVNGRDIELPALHARGRFSGTVSEWWFLDDPDNALALQGVSDQGAAPNVLGFGGEKRTRVVRITFPDPAARVPLARALATEGRAEAEGIFFDFGSDVLRPESEPVLAEIAAALKDNPSWRLGIAGHTDNVGGDAYNLDLSRRRAAAVKAALVGRHGIAAARLATEGFGATQPKASNDTPVGRARNRRVELQRR